MSNWQPLESNCEVINKYMNTIGLDTTDYTFQDLISLEDWAQNMVGRPVLGVLFTYEISPAQEAFRHQEEQRLAPGGQVVPQNVFYMKQYAENACGTIGCFHILGNLEDGHKHLLQTGSQLDSFFKQVQSKTPEQAGDIFENDQEIKDKHITATNEGDTNVENHMNTCNHFIAFVLKDGHIIELDGRKNRPINHGPSTRDTFLPDACTIVQGFMNRDPESLNVNTIVFAHNPAPEAD